MENDFPTNDISSLNKFTESTKENNKPFAIEEKEDIYEILDIIKQNRIPKMIDEDFTLLYLISMVKEGIEENVD